MTTPPRPRKCHRQPTPEARRAVGPSAGEAEEKLKMANPKFEASMNLSKGKWTLVGHRHEHEVYACLNSQGATCWYINHAGRSEAELNNGCAVPPLLAFPSDEPPLGFRPLAWSPVPDEPESEPCLCNSDRGPRSCPEHGVRCCNPDCDKLCDRVDSMSSLDANGKTLHWCSEACWRERHSAKQPKCDCGSIARTHSGDCAMMMAAPAEQPKVDPYEAHRRRWDESGSAAVLMRGFDGLTDATARLLRGLEGEKVRERVRAFPHPARNPR